MKNYLPEIALLNAKTTTGVSLAYPTADWQHVLFALSSQGNANFTIKFQGSFSEKSPNFAAAQTATNRWDYVQIKDYQNTGTVDGDTGISFTGADDVRQFELNTNGMRWISASITAISAGSANLHLSAYNNQ